MFKEPSQAPIEEELIVQTAKPAQPKRRPQANWQLRFEESTVQDESPLVVSAAKGQIYYSMMSEAGK